MKTKELYNAPEMEQVELQLEQTIAASLEGQQNEDGILDDWGTL